MDVWPLQSLPTEPSAQKDLMCGVECSVVALLKYLISLSLNLCFEIKLWWVNQLGAEVLKPQLPCGSTSLRCVHRFHSLTWCPGHCPDSSSLPSLHSYCHPPSTWWPDHTGRAKSSLHQYPLSPVGACMRLGLGMCLVGIFEWHKAVGVLPWLASPWCIQWETQPQPLIDLWSRYEHLPVVMRD